MPHDPEETSLPHPVVRGGEESEREMKIRSIHVQLSHK